mmetsp:Transcript_53674/g.143572  ORF Transcript_53674/g.143572 Transcript_53674/m.143572 type:complete len:210 (+) Transcript_53674:175-804(+)|eukprot:CAMPEP_0194504948 /NCGR_PEP_ID=MMETSP0253-20130528/30565_1 /TAXON_ID=2966 /ORGANISM="Noctiluca scintillans" /LENGTH=209 /DNA_ID=CAMNT_0039347419 /DNA_START=113 /DNA_END=742 /DNA_ORIENTATION=-
MSGQNWRSPSSLVNPPLQNHLLEGANTKGYASYAPFFVDGVQLGFSAGEWSTSKAAQSHPFLLLLTNKSVYHGAKCEPNSFPIHLPKLFHNASVEHAGNCGEPEKLHTSASNNDGKQDPSLPEWQRRGKSGTAMQPEDDDTIYIKEESEEDKAHSEQHPNELGKPRRRPVSYEEEQVQKGRRCLHGQQDRGIEGQHAVPSHDQSSNEEY